MEYKVDNSRGSKKYELTQAYKSYADYAFPNDETLIHVTKMQQIMFLVHRLMMNVNCPIGDMYCVSVLPVLIFISRELKEIHLTDHQ